MSAKINSSQTVFHVGRFRLDTEKVTLDNGVDTTLHVLRHPGAVAVVPFLNEATVILIQQYRHALGDYIWEIPAGTIDAGEKPLNCAGRELIEETGFRANNFDFLGDIFLAPGYSDERLHLFLGYDLVPDVQNLEPDEVLEVKQVLLTDALSMIESGEIRDAKTITGLLLADKQRKFVFK